MGSAVSHDPRLVAEPRLTVDCVDMRREESGVGGTFVATRRVLRGGLGGNGVGGRGKGGRTRFSGRVSERMEGLLVRMRSARSTNYSLRGW